MGPMVSSDGPAAARPARSPGRVSSSPRRFRNTPRALGLARRCRSPARYRPAGFATATADPLEDPPAIKDGSSGFTGVPNHGFVPNGNIASSCGFVFPTIPASAARAPARRGRVSHSRRGRPGDSAAPGGRRYTGDVDEILDRQPRTGAGGVQGGDERCHVGLRRCCRGSRQLDGFAVVLSGQPAWLASPTRMPRLFFRCPHRSGRIRFSHP